MNKNYSIKDIFQLMLTHIWHIIIISVLGAAVGFSVAEFILTPQYSSHIEMFVQSYTGISENVNNVNNISNSKQLVNTYVEVLQTDAVMNAIGDLLIEQYELDDLRQVFGITEDSKIDPNSIREKISISTVVDTSAVKIVATTPDAELSADICNNLTQVAPKYVEEAV